MKTNHKKNYQEYVVRVYLDRTEWYNQRNQLHREDGPAIEWFNGDKDWYKNGKLYREDGPAVERTNGDKFWYKNDELHREDGPAVEHANGDKIWYKNGLLHRVDGPAVEYANGKKFWYKNDELHREDGPAIEYANGDKSWWLEGKNYTKQEFLAKTKPSCNLVNKAIEIGGRKYRLIELTTHSRKKTNKKRITNTKKVDF